MQEAVKTSKPHSLPELAVNLQITGNSLEFELIIKYFLSGQNDSSVVNG